MDNDILKSFVKMSSDSGDRCCSMVLLILDSPGVLFLRDFIIRFIVSGVILYKSGWLSLRVSGSPWGIHSRF